MTAKEWGSKEWQEDHFPADQLDESGDTWGIRWRGMEKMRHRSYLKLIGNDLQSAESLKVLDIGCALCDFTEKAWNLNQSNQFWGMDMSENAINWVRKKFPMFTFEAGAIPDIPFDIEFDVVLCLEVACYVDAEDRKKTIDNIYGVLAPSGTLMFSGVLDGGRQHHTEEEVIGLIQNGFEIQKVVFNHWSLYRTLIETPLETLRFVINSLLQALELSNDGFQEWQSNSGGGAKSKLAKVLRFGDPLSSWLLRAIRLPIRPILGWAFLAKLFHSISEVTKGSKKADEIVVLAVKK